MVMHLWQGTLYAKKGREESQHRCTAQKMRELGRFVLAAKEIDSSFKGLKDLCDPTQFDFTIQAARSVSNYSTSTSEYIKPSTVVKIGFSLKGAAEPENAGLCSFWYVYRNF